MTIMDEDVFWAMVEDARSDVDDTRTGDGAAEVAARIENHLTELGRDAAVAFTLRYDAFGVRSYDWNLWAAAYLMKGGCSDDAFDYFRAWLLVQGRHSWDRALHDPDTLADLDIDPDDDFLECEDLLGVGRRAFGDEEAFYATLDAARGTLPAGTFNGPLTGDDFDHDDDDEVRARYPRLAEIYLSDGQRARIASVSWSNGQFDTDPVPARQDVQDLEVAGDGDAPGTHGHTLTETAGDAGTSEGSPRN